MSIIFLNHDQTSEIFQIVVPTLKASPNDRSIAYSISQVTSEVFTYQKLSDSDTDCFSC